MCTINASAATLADATDASFKMKLYPKNRDRIFAMHFLHFQVEFIIEIKSGDLFSFLFEYFEVGSSKPWFQCWYFELSFKFLCVCLLHACTHSAQNSSRYTMPCHAIPRSFTVSLSIHSDSSLSFPVSRKLDL